MCSPIFWSDSLNSSISLRSAAVSEPFATVFRVSSFAVTSALTSAGIFASLSFMTFSAWWIMWSAWLRSSASSRGQTALLDHPLDLVLRQRRRRSDRHGLLAAGAIVLGLHVEDAVVVEV